MIRIASDGVTLDGRGHAVVGNGVSDTTAIAAGGESTLSDVVVRNVAVEAWEVGLSFRNVERATVRGVESTGNSYGVILERVAAPRLVNCSIRENLVGVFLDAGVSSPSAFDPESGNDVSDNRLADVRRGDDC
jgi:nitrous oxidase accessory protein NosD